MTPREADHAMRGAAERDHHMFRQAQVIAYRQAGLIAYAPKNPHQMISFEKAFPDTKAGKPKAQTEAESTANLNAWANAINAYHHHRNPGKAMQ